ncbi:MAG TPA: ABC-2 family transporter protein [Ktedonobacteraceae bacterium]|nr:ABC-2 family transporter protein [Ktedonobacteraceae bacterium]
MIRLLRMCWSTLGLVQAYVVANLQAAMEYRLAFVSQVLIMLLNDCLWLFYWWTYFHQFPLVHGWRVTDILVLWSLSACGFGLSAAIFGNAGQMVPLIMNGGLDAYLGMPRNVLLHVSIAATRPIAWGDLLFGLGVYLLFIHPDAFHIVLFFFLVLLGACIFTAFLIMLCSLAFFLGNTEGLVSQVFGALITFCTYPMDIFHGAVKLLLFTVLPAGFITFVPIQLLHQFSWPLLAVLIGVTLIFVLVAVGLFHLGLRRYESGSLLGMQN